MAAPVRLVVRPARHGDIGRLVGMMAASNVVERGFSPDLATRHEDRRHYRRCFVRDLRTRGTRWWVARANRCVIGMLGIDLHRARHRYVVTRRHVYIHSLFVASGWRGCGAGRALVRRALSWARRCGAQQARLEMAAGNAAARALYESFGFTVREHMFSRALGAAR
jgi:GNAT superfamily N-acetyltransferase